MKRKFSLLFNIATLVLCISAIAFGVYSAKTASLNVSGTVGFTAHDCKVAVTGTILGHATTPDGEPIATAQPIEGVTVPDKTTLGLGTVYFSDLTSEGTINPITLTLYFENLSDFDVKVDITPQTVEGITIEISPDSVILSDKSAGTDDKKKPVVVKLTCESTSTGITPANKQILQVQMAKYTAPASSSLTVRTANDFFWNNVATNTRSYVTMGTYNEEALRWYIFAQGNTEDSMSAVTGAVETNADNTLKAGTYWFISEYVLDCDTANENYGIMFDDSSNIYGNSDIKAYLDGTGSGTSFVDTYGITEGDAVYSQITARNLPKEDASGDVGEFTAVANQKLWLLSVSELACLNNNDAVTLYSSNNNLIAQDATSSHTASYWWLRSPDAFGGTTAFGVYDDGSVNYLDVFGFDGGVRAAFQITISG